MVASEAERIYPSELKDLNFSVEGFFFVSFFFSSY